MFIYVIVNRATLKIYIGQHKGDSLRQYLQRKLSAAAHREAKGSHLFASMRKYPKDVWSIWPVVSGIKSHRELNKLERHFIRVLKAQHPDIGYNICAGGEGGQTIPWTAERREFMRAKFQGRVFTPEWREKIRQSKLGNTVGSDARWKGHTHCPQGHELTDENCIPWKLRKFKHRECKICANLRSDACHRAAKKRIELDVA